MTIARNIEQQDVNWSEWSVWSWYISNGVTNDGTHWCWSWATNTIYTNLSREFATKTWVWNWIWENTSCDEKRQLKLSNGIKIWDLAGNINEHVNKANTIGGENHSLWQTSVAWSWCASATLAWASEKNWCWALSTYRGTYWPLTSWGTDKWFGNVRNPQWVTSNVFLRGGNADNVANAGIYTLSLVWGASDERGHAGFRCAL
jgi:hypothetical protein